MQTRSKFQHRLVALMLFFALTISVMTGCGSEKKDETSTKQEATNTSDTTQEKKVEKLPLDTVLLTIDDKDYTIEELMYVIYCQEEYYGSMATDYAMSYGLDFWNDILDEMTNETGSQMAMNATIKMAKSYVLLRKQAQDAGYKLTSEEEDDLKAVVNDILENMGEEQKERTGFTEEKLIPMVRDYMIVSNYMTDQVQSQKVNENKIKESIDYKDYKQRELEYIYVSTVQNDGNGNMVEKSPEEAVELVKQAKEILSKVNDGMTLEQAYEQAAKEDDESIQYGVFSMTDDEMEESLLKVVDFMEEGQTYDRLVETEGGYYIVKLTKSKSTELYDDTVLDNIETAKEEAYDKKLQQLFKEHSIIEHEEAWDKIVLGSYAYTQTEEAQMDDSNYFENNDSDSQGSNILTEEEANGDDGSVG